MPARACPWLIVLLVSSCAALVPLAPARRQPTHAVAAGQPLPLSRRAALLSSTLALLPPLPACAEDALVAGLQDARAQFEGADRLVQSGQWDEVRKLVAMTLTLLSLKGYRGSSVKSRALELTEGPERQGLLDARAKLLQALGALDRLAYERQKVSPLSADAKEFDPTAALDGVRMSAAALDDILKRLS